MVPSFVVGSTRACCCSKQDEQCSSTEYNVQPVGDIQSVGMGQNTKMGEIWLSSCHVGPWT